MYTNTYCICVGSPVLYNDIQIHTHEHTQTHTHTSARTHTHIAHALASRPHTVVLVA